MEIDVNDDGGAIGCLFIVLFFPILIVAGAIERSAKQAAAASEMVELAEVGLPVVRWRDCYRNGDFGVRR